MSAAIDAPLAAYLGAMGALTPESVPALRPLLAEDVRYSDPFNQLTGPDAFLRVFRRMFEDCVDPRFTMLGSAVSGRTAYARWRMTFRPRRWPGTEPWIIDGMSELRFDDAGKLAAHIDHWDAASQLYARFPVLGRVLRALRRRLSAE